MSDLIRRASEALVDVTPGPWGFIESDSDEIHVHAADRDPDSYVPICSRDTGYNDNVDHESRANFGFIAAARDLVPAMADRLEAQEALLREAVWRLNGLMDVTEPPEGNCTCHIKPPCGWCVEYEMVAEEHKQARATLAKLRQHLGETE